MLNSVVGSVLRPIVRSIFDVFGTRPSPSLALNFVTSSSLDPRITFTRTSNATVTDSTGTLVYAPHNLLTFSEQFDNAVWTKTRATIAANSTAAPDGTSTADKLVEDTTATNTHNVGQSISFTSGTTYTVSVFAKATESPRFLQIIFPSGAFGVTRRPVFDLLNGTASAATDTTASIQNIGNGWYRCVASMQATSTSSASAQLQLADTYTNGSPAYTGDGTSGIFIWGAQLNVGSLQPYYTTTVKNLLGFTQEFDNAAIVKTRATISADATVAPDGSLTADKLVEDTTASNSHFMTLTSTSLTSGTPYVFSFYAKSDGSGRRIQAGFPNTAFGTTTRVSFNVDTQVVTAGTGATGTIIAVGNGWYRCSATMTATLTASAAMFLALAVTDAASLAAATYTGDGTSGIFIWGAQLSDSASLDPYVYNPGAAPASTAYFGPRFDYNPVTLAPKGLLIEEQRTNFLTYSEQFDNAAWTKTRSSITANATTSPDGTVDADKLVEDTTAANSHQTSQNFNATSGTTYTLSVYIKAAERTFAGIGIGDGAFTVNQAITVNLSTGATSIVSGTPTTNVQAVGDGWYKVSITATATSTTVAIARLYVAESSGTIFYTGDGTSGIYLWGAQLEAGAFATSYIPTVASQVTRAADVAVMTGANFSNWYNQSEGTLYAEVVSAPVNNIAQQSWNISDGATNNTIFSRRTTIGSVATAVVVGGVLQGDISSGAAISAGATYKSAFAYKVNDLAISTNSATVAADTSATIPVVDRITIGSSVAAVQHLNGHISRIAYFPRRLSNAELQGITS